MGRYTTGLALVAFGGLWLLDALRLFEMRWTFIWAIMLIGVGLILITRAARRDRGLMVVASDGFAGMGDYKASFKDTVDGTDISHVFGEIRLDLSDAQLAPGVNHLHANLVAGDIHIIVAAGMEVELNTDNLIGDVVFFGEKQTSFFTPRSLRTPGYSTAAEKLALTCYNVFGDISVARKETQTTA